MNFNPFSIFQKDKSNLIVPDSILVKRIKSLAKNSNLQVFSNIAIYLHRQSYNIELMLYDNTRGIYIFEIKKWSFDDLKNATIAKAQNQEHSSNTLAYDKTQEIIKRKFNEITHSDGPKIYNYLLMENLSAEEYEHLDDSFKTLLPKDKIIFSDSLTSDIFKKLENEEKIEVENPVQNLETLFTQYTKLQDDGTFLFCTPKEMEFLDSPLKATTHFSINSQEAKGSLLLLKAIIEIFKKQSRKIIIVKPSILARDIAYKKMLDIVEHGIIEFDMNAIELLTPLELINRHLNKLKKPMLHDLSALDPQLLKKSYDAADLIICDDAVLLHNTFIQYVQHIQKNKKVLFVNLSDSEHSLEYETTSSVEFLKTNPLAKTMQLLQKFSQQHIPAEDILVVSNPENKEKLKEDLKYFLAEKTIDIESSKTLLEHNLKELKLSTYDDIFELNTKHIILLDLCDYNENQIEYAFNLATNSVYVLYDHSCEMIDMLKEKYESNQN